MKHITISEETGLISKHGGWYTTELYFDELGRVCEHVTLSTERPGLRVVEDSKEKVWP